MSLLQREKENDKRILQMIKLEPYRTELKQEVIARRRELTRIHLLKKEKTQIKRASKGTHGHVVTIDTNKARSNANVLRLVIRDLGWREFPFQRPAHNCDITWHATRFSDQSEIYSGQVNKFPGSVEIFRKVNTFRWLEFMKAVFPSEYNFFPRTWLLPYHFNEFAYAVKSAKENKAKQKPVYIVKPSEGSQGQGIYLLEDPFSYSNYNNKSHVVQEYLSDVFLIDKYKFDLRIYVVLKCLDPLELYICREGLARFSTIPYEQPTNKNLHEIFMHLTNYSLNKKSGDFKISDKDDEGSKRKMSAVFKEMRKLGHDVDALWGRIEHLVTLTLIAVAGELKVEHQAALPSGKPGPTCFQVLGFDIILLSNLQPMLLEVNSNPSLSISEERETPGGSVDYVISLKDEEVKRTLIRDTLLLVAPKNKYTRRRHRQRYYRHLKKNTEEKMDTDSSSSDNSINNRRILRRQNSTSITHTDNDTTNKETSMFYQSQEKSGKRRGRKEKCRVFIEGEGEVFFSDEESSNSKYLEDSVDPQTENTSSIKSWVNKLMGKDKIFDRKRSTTNLPDVFPKDDQRSEDVAMEEVNYDESHLIPTESSQIELSKDVNDNEKEKNEEDEEQSCLKEIFPALYGQSLRSERIVERLADIFIVCLGIKGYLRLTPSMFRLFARRCHLYRKGDTNADIDILYIEMERKFDYMNQEERMSGLNFFGFVSSCCKLASKTFPGNSQKAQINGFINHCQNYLKIPTDLDLEAVKRESRYGHEFGRNRDRERGAWKLPSADGIQKVRGIEHRLDLLVDGFSDRRFPILQNHHRNIFHMLQSLKK